MKKEEILKKALEKAVENGLDKGFASFMEKELIIRAPYHIIFNHNFAKAFFGEECIECNKFPRHETTHLGKGGDIAWQYHLQMMVLEPDPVLYLEQFL